MKKIIFSLFIFLIFLIPVFAQTVLKSGVEVKNIPNSFYGNWRVSSILVDTNTVGMFKEKNVDFWNLSRENDVIKLENPFSGAKQSITVHDVKSDFIKFTKVGNYSGKQLTDEVTINLGKDTFWGINTIKLQTFSDVDGHIMKTDWASYQIKGEKLSGTSLED